MSEENKIDNEVRFPPVLDICCGGKCFWFDKHDNRAIYIDRRIETIVQKQTKRKSRHLNIEPDIVADFTNLPFKDNSFACVIFDPPHKISNSTTGTLEKFYGTLTGEWRKMISEGFSECFRVLRMEGILVFKWCESNIPLREILKLTPEIPLIANKKPAISKTHWILFIKHNKSRNPCQFVLRI